MRGRAAHVTKRRICRSALSDDFSKNKKRSQYHKVLQYTALEYVSKYSFTAPTNAHLTPNNIFLYRVYMFRCHLRHLQEASYTGINNVKKFWNNQNKYIRPLI